MTDAYRDPTAEQLREAHADNQRLRKELEEWKRACSDARTRTKWDGGDYGTFGVFAVLAVVVGGLLYTAARHIFSDSNHVDYCYTRYIAAEKSEPAHYILRGHVPWTEGDLPLGEYPTLAETLAAADKLHCQIGIGK